MVVLREKLFRIRTGRIRHSDVMVGHVAGERNQFQLFDGLTAGKYDVGHWRSGGEQTWGKSSEESKSSLRFIAMSEDEREGTLWGRGD